MGRLVKDFIRSGGKERTLPAQYAKEKHPNALGPLKDWVGGARGLDRVRCKLINKVSDVPSRSCGKEVEEKRSVGGRAGVGKE